MADRKIVLTKDDLNLIMQALDTHSSDHPDEAGTEDDLNSEYHTAVRKHIEIVEFKILTILNQRYAASKNKIHS